MQNPKKGRILIVDDENTNLDVLNHILKNEYTVYVAKTGEMALKRASYDRPDLILLDIMLPDMSGYDVLKELKENDETKTIPVIFLTSLSSVADEERGFLLGVVDYVTKPFNNSIVKARIRNHMRAVQLVRTIERLGIVDGLTGIANRRCFDERLAIEGEKAARGQRPLSIMSIDVDMFRQYNDTYGYLQGDVLLQSLVKVFSDHIRANNDLAARIGGEEFAIILPETGLKEAVAIAENIRQAVESLEIPSMGSMVTQATVSIGVASGSPTQRTDAHEIFKEADQELYRAKQKGRNQVCPGC